MASTFFIQSFTFELSETFYIKSQQFYLLFISRLSSLFLLNRGWCVMIFWLWYHTVLGGGEPTLWHSNRRELRTATVISPPSEDTPATTKKWNRILESLLCKIWSYGIIILIIVFYHRGVLVNYKLSRKLRRFWWLKVSGTQASGHLMVNGHHHLRLFEYLRHIPCVAFSIFEDSIP